MNKRILKKLCKRAAPLLAEFGDTREQFRVERHDPPAWTCPRMDRKSLDRWGGKPCSYGFFDALKGTVGVGSMSVGEEPEWEDEPAYDALLQHLYWRYAVETGMRSDFGTEYSHPDLSTPAKVFALLKTEPPKAPWDRYEEAA